MENEEEVVRGWLEESYEQYKKEIQEYADVSAAKLLSGKCDVPLRNLYELLDFKFMDH